MNRYKLTLFWSGCLVLLLVAMVVGALVHGEPLGISQWAAMLCCAAALRLALVPAKAA